MDIQFLSKAIKLSTLVVIFLHGCAGFPEVKSDAPPPDVLLGPEIQLLDVPTKKISAAVDRDGLVHVLAATSKPSELHHLMVGPEGVIGRDIVTRGGSYRNLDVVFDNSGTLHAIVDEDHLVLEKGTWHALQKDPCTKLLQAGQDFFCAFSVEGKDFGAPGNWDWYGGGAPAGGCMCFFPWFSYPDKLVVARKIPAGWSEWTVFDVETKFEIETFSMAADNSGTVHVLYKTKEGGDVNVDCECVYARIEPITPGRSSESRQLYNSDLGEKPRSQARVSGQAFSKTRNPDLGCYDIAVDPETGTGLMTVGGLYISNWFPSYSHIVQDGLISPQVRIPTVEYPHLEPAGKGRFHALGGRRIIVRPGYTLYYLVYDNGMWSAPVELGEGIDRFENIVLVSDLNRRALALWRKKKKRPVARWVELVE